MSFSVLRIKMQKLTIVLLFCVVALSFVSAEEAKLKSMVTADVAKLKSRVAADVAKLKSLVSADVAKLKRQAAPEGAYFKRLTPIDPEPYCSGWDIAWCAEEIAGKNNQDQQDKNLRQMESVVHKNQRRNMQRDLLMKTKNTSIPILCQFFFHAF